MIVAHSACARTAVRPVYVHLWHNHTYLSGSLHLVPRHYTRIDNKWEQDDQLKWVREAFARRVGSTVPVILHGMDAIPIQE